MSDQSPESERNAVPEQTQWRRETYHRPLSDGTNLNTAASTYMVGPPRVHVQQVHPMHRPVPTTFPRSTIMRALMDHPVLCAVGVAAIVAIGPRRIVKTIATGASAAGALTARNQSNVDMLGKVLTIVGAYVQGRTHDQTPHM